MAKSWRQGAVLNRVVICPQAVVFVPCVCTQSYLAKSKNHYTSFPVASPQQVGNFPVYGKVTGKRVYYYYYYYYYYY